MLIQRADGSLEGTLNQLSQKVPDRYRHLFNALGRRQEMTLQGRSLTFLANLSVATRIDAFSEELEHAQWCHNYQVDTLLNNQAVLDNWTSPGRILKILSGSDGERNSTVARFTFGDMVELASLEHLMGRSLPTKAMQLARRLQREADRIRNYQNEGLSDEQIRQSFSKEVGESMTLMDALNSRLNHAIQNLLGISAHGLRELFFTLRTELKKENRRLVLLLEDITNFQGVDNQLVDVLVTQSSTRVEGDYCDLISVVGITPAYLREHLRANYQARITHHIQLGTNTGHAQHQDVANLRTAESQVAFVANYLRAVRAGLPLLEDWAKDDSQPIPNVCTSCAYQPQCHGDFGDIQGVGLYPFTARAVVGMFARLEDPRNAMTHRTPRGIIQGILTPTLLNPHTIEDGSFPSSKVEISWLPEHSRRLTGPARQLLASQIQDQEVRERIERLITLWGDQTAIKSTRDSEGNIRFAGITRGVYERFGLPWLGDEIGAMEAAPEAGAEVPPVVQREVTRTARTKGIDDLRTDLASATQRDPRPSAAVGDRSTRTALKSSELDLRRRQILAWIDEQPLEQPDFWNQLCFELVEQLPWNAMDVPAWVRLKFFTKDLVKLEGTGRTTSLHFVIPAGSWLKHGLESYLEVRFKTVENIEYHRRKVALMNLLLRECVRGRAESLVPKVDDVRWSALGSLTQLLAAAHWVTQRVSPEESMSRQWLLMIGKEEATGSDGSDRTEAWKRLVEQLRLIPGTSAPVLMEWVGLQREKDGSIFTSPAECYRALSELRVSLKFWRVPQDLPNTQNYAELVKVAKKITEVSRDLQRLPGLEKRRIIDACKDINDLLRGRSLREHLFRVSNAVQRVGQVIPVPDNSLEEFQRRYRGLQESLLKEPPTLDILDFVDQTLETADQADWGDDQIAASVLGWTLRAPVHELRITLETLRSAERAITSMMNLVSLFADTSESPDDKVGLDRVHQVGSQMRQISEDFRKALGGR